jgi:uncharacterized membrane protein SpoIIM required for sporulation
MFAGLLTLWVMILNGLMLGSLTGVAAYYNIAFELWTFVIGHGVIELSVIMIGAERDCKSAGRSFIPAWCGGVTL